jgi:sugar phosphate isomerase/epimerase
MRAGLNLYSLRDFIGNEEAYLNTLKSLKEMGYSYLQFSGAPLNEEMIIKGYETYGLPTVLTHMPYDRIVADTEALMDAHAKFGCYNIGLGALPHHLLGDEQKVKDALANLEEAAMRMEKRGFHFYYHHHHFEFAPFADTTLFDYMVENCPHFHFILDTYWLQYGGVSVVDTIKRLKGRIGCIHLKDYGVLPVVGENGGLNFVPTFVPVGTGNIDFPAVVSAAKESGTQFFLVEQDNASTNPDPFGDVEKSIRYIREEL